MTDGSMPDRPGSPSAPVIAGAQVPVQQQVAESPGATAAAAKPGGWRAVIIIGVIVAFIAIVLFVVRNNVAADDLKVGDCFNIPDGTTIQTVERQPCTESHNAEVIFVGDYTEGTTYPISLTLDRFIESACVPAFETYLGRSFDSDPELSIGYFYPSRDGWDNGDRTITCYVAQPDESPMTESFKG